MKYRERVVQSIYAAVDEVNEMLPENEQLAKTTHTLILDGNKGVLDSQGLISFTVATEEKIELEFGIELSLTEENIFSQETSPLQNIGTLADFISAILEEKGRG